MMKKLVITAIVILILAVGGYWGWHEYAIGQLKQNVQEASASQSRAETSNRFLSSFSVFTETAERSSKRSEMPLFGDRYREIESEIRSLFEQSGKRASDWVICNRAKAWSDLGDELHPKANVTDAELVETVRELRGVCQTGLAAQDRIVETAGHLGVEATSLAGMGELANETKETAEQASDLASVGQSVVRIKGKARAEVQEGLRLMDKANRDVEKYAEVAVLRQVYYDWQSAYSMINSSKYTLSRLPSFSKPHQNQLAKALVKDSLDRVNAILLRIEPNLNKARSELRRAEEQERTLFGRTQRTLGRLLNQATESVSSSRIGKELAVSFKALVLGTKMFYDMMEMDASTDVMAWALSYENDMNQLMNEVDEINEMDGWSLTGKNTFVENLVDSAYMKSFNKTSKAGNDSEQISIIVKRDQYICHDSSYRLLKESDLLGKSAWELDIMRNEIFARHGRPFQRLDLRNYFGQFPWYKVCSDYNDTDLSDLEWKNARFILNYQNRHRLRTTQ